MMNTSNPELVKITGDAVVVVFCFYKATLLMKEAFTLDKHRNG